MPVKSAKIDISVVIGRATLPVSSLLRMGRGAVIELDSRQNDDVWVFANGTAVARGQIVIQGEKIAVAITDILHAAA
jgi:flagellar motor switch protein FliN/FliY